MSNVEMGVTRRAFLQSAVAGGAAVAFSDLLPAGADAAAGCPEFRASLSVSPFIEAVLKQVVLSDGVHSASSVLEAQRLFNAHGATEVYARIATSRDAPGGDSNTGWESQLARARLARDLDMPFNPEIMLDGTYGDASTYQDPPIFDSYPEIRLPGPWLSLTLEQMLPPMRQYGALVARQILNTGVRVNYWDLGNEVENGIAGVCVYPLFPITNYQPPNNVDPLIGTQSTAGFVAEGETARIAFCQQHLWPYVARLLAAARDGIRSVDPNARFSTHISDFAQATPATQLAFWQVAKDNGYLPDLLGSSYYPTDGKTTTGPLDKFQWFKDTAAALGQKFGRGMFIAEYGYPSATMPPPYPFNDQVPGYTQDASGQQAFTHDLVQWGVQSGRLAGLRPWAPDYCTNSGWQPMSWFDVSGRATQPKPVLHAISDVVGLQRCPHPSGVRINLRFLGESGDRILHAELSVSRGSLGGLTLRLARGGRILGHKPLPTLTTRPRRVALKVAHRPLANGVYQLAVTQRGHSLLTRSVHIR